MLIKLNLNGEMYVSFWIEEPSPHRFISKKRKTYAYMVSTYFDNIVYHNSPIHLRLCMLN